MAAILASIVDTALNFFGSAMSILAMFVVVDDADKIVVTRGRWGGIVLFSLLFCFGIASLIYFMRERKARKKGGVRQLRIPGKLILCLVLVLAVGGMLHMKHEGEGAVWEDFVWGKSVKELAAELPAKTPPVSTPPPSITPEQRTFLLEVVCENNSSFTNYTMMVLAPWEQSPTEYRYDQLPIELLYQAGAYRIQIIHGETGQQIYEETLDCDEYAAARSVSFWYQENLASERGTFILDVFCEDDCEFTDYQVELLTPSADFPTTYESEAFPMELEAERGSYRMEVYQISDEGKLLLEHTFSADEGAFCSFSFCSPEPSLPSEPDGLALLKAEYEWFPYANLHIELMENGGSADGLELCIGYMDSIEIYHICDYQEGGVWVQVPPLCEYTVYVMEGDMKIASEKINVMGFLDDNAYHNLIIHLP